jgi:hypothetical protein
VEKASTIINRYTNVRFRVADYGVWNSDNRITDLNRTLAEFEHEIDPSPAHLAIGFSSQYRFQKGINGLGGTRGPLCSHILLRESSPSTREPERLEALVHELGHYLGAAHSNSPKSVRRPVVGDGRARLAGYPFAFDDKNAQIIQWVGTEVSALGIHRFSQLSQLTKDRLLVQYQQLDRELPRDPAAKRYIQMIQQR